MSVEETKRLLREFRIVPNRLLGQNFMVEPSVFDKLVNYAEVSKSDVVLDVGAGFGFLSRFLSNSCSKVVAVEKDPRVAGVLREQLRDIGNVTVIEGDVLKARLPKFNKVVAIPPYYLSSRLILWLLAKKVECALLILQREFADRLTADVGNEDYGWLAIVAYHDAQVELLDAVTKELFYPSSEVDSVIMRLRPWETAPFEVRDAVFFKRMVRWLFTQRNKKLGNALAPFIRSIRGVSKDEAERLACCQLFSDRRVRELSPKDFGALANELAD
jgi:16S rRNA (adenine1518-N6/adenine1519-N6)-dimethyltransferase